MVLFVATVKLRSTRDMGIGKCGTALRRKEQRMQPIREEKRRLRLVVGGIARRVFLCPERLDGMPFDRIKVLRPPASGGSSSKWERATPLTKPTPYLGDPNIQLSHTVTSEAHYCLTAPLLFRTSTPGQSSVHARILRPLFVGSLPTAASPSNVVTKTHTL